ncbi:MAG: hypothetical protein QM715_16120 [Nibricoccus sp.]
MSIAFLTDKALARIHADFLDDPTTTDVITFEGNAQLGSGGEICVSVRHRRRVCLTTRPQLFRRTHSLRGPRLAPPRRL